MCVVKTWLDIKVNVPSMYRYILCFHIHVKAWLRCLYWGLIVLHFILVKKNNYFWSTIIDVKYDSSIMRCIKCFIHHKKGSILAILFIYPSIEDFLFSIPVCFLRYLLGNYDKLERKALVDSACIRLSSENCYMSTFGPC